MLNLRQLKHYITLFKIQIQDMHDHFFFSPLFILNMSSSKRRQSSSYSEDLSRYEFVDYTSVSHFEKFVTHIEETLYSWGIKDGSYGIFSQQQVANVKAAIAQPSPVEFTRREELSMSDDVYQLTYYCHPTITTSTTDTEEGAVEHFHQFNTVQYHPLHRWTGQERLLVLKPMQDSLKKKIFNTNKSSIDISQTKQLISACAIAFQNTGCRVPVFVPVGQNRHEMYMGYGVTTQQPDSPFNETEVRYNMTLTIPPAADLSYLEGLKTLFLQKLSMHREDYGKSGEAPDASVYISAVYTYNLKNWFDENWKDWEEISEKETKRRGSFSDDFEAWGDEDDGADLMEADGQDTGLRYKRKLEKMNQHQLTFGSFNDPLRALTLSALFPLIQENEFHEAYDRNMDALTAKQWQISREFAPVSQQRAYLATLVEQVVESWIKDPTNREYLAPYDDDNDEPINDGAGLMHHLFTAGNRNKFSAQMGASTGTSTTNSSTSGLADSITVTKSDAVDNVLTALFHPMTCKEDTTRKSTTPCKFDNTKKLVFKLKCNSTVPYRSFLWNLLLYSLEESSKGRESGSKKNITSFLGFLKMVWIEVLKQIRWHWENSEAIPSLSPYLYGDSSAEVPEKDSKTLGIDLRYNILHQKIAMVNCCILRRKQNAPQNGNVGNTAIKPVRQAGSLFNQMAEKQVPKLSKFQTLLERFVEGGADNDNSEAIEDSITFALSDLDDNQVSDESDLFVDAVDASSSDSGGSQNNLTQSQQEDEEVEVVVPSMPFTVEELEADEVNAVKDPEAIEGESTVHDSLKLLKTGQPMHIPITQDPGFMTEDMITQQADLFEKLGTSISATQQRAKLQSAQLYSDMQAFKAANPHACLEDFVRWHSPRDWVADKDGEGGRLSTRMSEPNNIWQELWKWSKRIPCVRQKPLFNLCAEAEKALHFLETTSIHDFFSLMLPTLGLIAYDTLSVHPIAQYSQHVSNGLIHLSSELVDFPWEELRQGKQTFDGIISAIRHQESLMCHAISLLRKLPRQYDLVDQLLLNDQTIVKEGDERSAVFQLFRNDRGIISEPTSSEYILYSDCKDLTSPGRILPSRQYAIVKDNEIRIMYTQTTDALFA
ncbi:Rab3 GTPase-activating protein catalytic subunit-domain-containing protein [Parasitella parasitica]|nr:Rab3 GTPase-activating protein catalytic subunit-domain-containing protein [Parasitella parasitica]